MKKAPFKYVGLILVTALVANVMLSGCTSQYVGSVWKQSTQKVALTERYTVSRHYEWVVHPHDSVYLSAVTDTQTPKRSRQTYQFDLAMREAVSQYFPNSVAGTSELSLADALNAARLAGKSLLFFPRLGAVEDKLNTGEELIDGKSVNPHGEFGPDKAFFQVHIYEVRTGKLLDVSTVKARGKLFAGKNTLPTDLFSDGAQAFINNLQLAASEQ